MNVRVGPRYCWYIWYSRFIWVTAKVAVGSLVVSLPADTEAPEHELEVAELAIAKLVVAGPVVTKQAGNKPAGIDLSVNAGAPSRGIDLSRAGLNAMVLF